MGPAATVDFLAKLVAATPVDRDQHHLPTVVWSRPQIPDRSTAILNGDNSPLPCLLEGVEILERAGADFIAISCNSAHDWHAALQAHARGPVLHIADAAAAEIQRRGLRKVGLLSTRGTIAAGFYQRRLDGLGELILPGEAVQRRTDLAIAEVKAGRSGRRELEEAITRILALGAQAVILACTELPIAARGSVFGARCIDVTQALAETCVAMSYGADFRTIAGACVRA
jgi:aspartate racemase